MTERSRSGAVFVVTAYLIAIRLVTATGMRPIRSVLAPAGNLLTNTYIASHDDNSLAGARPLAKRIKPCRVLSSAEERLYPSTGVESTNQLIKKYCTDHELATYRLFYFYNRNYYQLPNCFTDGNS